jgi:energy-coupling factor transport system permease protein
VKKFISNITLNYIRKDSPIHKMDALSKLLAVLILSVGSYFFQTPWQLMTMFCFLVVLALFFIRVEPIKVIATFSIFILFGSFVFLFQMLGHPEGTIYAQFGFIKITSGGLFNAAIFLFRMATIGCSAVIFLWTTKPKDFVVGLITLGVPYRIGFAILVGLRFLPLMSDEVRKVGDAHAIRGVPAGTGVKGILDKWKRYLFPVLANGMRKAETAGMAMESRGFGVQKSRTYINPFQWTASGIGLLLFVILLTVVLGSIGGFKWMQPKYNQ